MGELTKVELEKLGDDLQSPVLTALTRTEQTEQGQVQSVRSADEVAVAGSCTVSGTGAAVLLKFGGSTTLKRKET